MASPGQLKRLRRVERRSLPEALAAYHAGQLSARTLDSMLYLPREQQQAELTRRLSEARQREERHRTVATAIKQYLDGLGNQKVDLVELSKIIKKALAA
jgi:hypothetical protein